MLLANIDIEHFTFEVLPHNPENRGESIKLRIGNIDTKSHKIGIESSRYNSKLSGIVRIYASPYDIIFDSLRVPANSFVDVVISFNDVREIVEGDIFELIINERWAVDIEYRRCISGHNWTAIRNIDLKAEKNNTVKSLEKHIINSIERFASMEEKAGITLKKLKAKIDKDDDEYTFFWFYFDVMTLGKMSTNRSVLIDFVVYGHNNSIVYVDTIYAISQSDSEVSHCEFDGVSLNIPICDISKIRIYPTLQ